MPLIDPDKAQAQYDVIVVGSGAAGGQTAYTLTMEGAKVLMLEAGRNYDPVKETPMFQTTAQAHDLVVVEVRMDAQMSPAAGFMKAPANEIGIGHKPLNTGHFC